MDKDIYGPEENDPAYAWRVALIQAIGYEQKRSNEYQCFKLQEKMKFPVNRAIYPRLLMVELLTRGEFVTRFFCKSRIQSYAGNELDEFIYIIKEICSFSPELLIYWLETSAHQFLKSIYALKEFITARLIKELEILFQKIGFTVPDDMSPMPIDEIMGAMGFKRFL